MNIKILEMVVYLAKRVDFEYIQSTNKVTRKKRFEWRRKSLYLNCFIIFDKQEIFKTIVEVPNIGNR